MTNEMRVRRAKSAKIGKTLTAFLIPGADGDTVTVARQIVVQMTQCIAMGGEGFKLFFMPKSITF